MSCNHVWRDTVMPTAKVSKAELLASVTNAGTVGWWLKAGEREFSQELVLAGKLKPCLQCNGAAVLVT